MATTFAIEPQELFEQLYARHVQDVYRYSLALLRNPADAEDVTQTTFMNAYRAIKRGERPEKPHHWLIVIAHNACRTRVSRAARRPREVPLDESVQEVALPESERPNLRAVLEALGRLPFNQRSALVMRELEGRSYDEIAAALGVTVPAVETLIFRARRSLRLRRDAFRSLALVQAPGSLASFGGSVASGGGIVLGGAAIKAAALVAAIVAGGAAYEAVATGPSTHRSGRAGATQILLASEVASTAAARHAATRAQTRRRATATQHASRSYGGGVQPAAGRTPSEAAVPGTRPTAPPAAGSASTPSQPSGTSTVALPTAPALPSTLPLPAPTLPSATVPAVTVSLSTTTVAVTVPPPLTAPSLP